MEDINRSSERIAMEDVVDHVSNLEHCIEVKTERPEFMAIVMATTRRWRGVPVRLMGSYDLAVRAELHRRHRCQLRRFHDAAPAVMSEFIRWRAVKSAEIAMMKTSSARSRQPTAPRKWRLPSDADAVPAARPLRKRRDVLRRLIDKIFERRAFSIFPT